MTEQLLELKARLTYFDEYTHDYSVINHTLGDLWADPDNFLVDTQFPPEVTYSDDKKISEFVQQKVFEWVPLDVLRKEVKKNRHHTNAHIEFYYNDDDHYHHGSRTYDVMIDFKTVYENLSEHLQSMINRKMDYSPSQVAQWLMEIQVEQAFISLYLRHKDLSTLLEDYIYDLCSLTGDEEVLKEVFAQKYKF